MPLALACIGLAISLWIVVPGPVLPLFVITVGATELWPVIAAYNAAVLVACARSRTPARTVSTVIAGAALVCSLVPPVAYALGGAHVPLAAFFAPLPLYVQTAPAGAPIVLDVYGGAWEHGSPRSDAGFDAILTSWGYRVIGLRYPHAPASRWPAQRDVVLHQIDALPPGRAVIVGHSSGAQLALIAAALRPKRIAGVVTYESPVDLALGYAHPSQPDIVNLRRVLIDLCDGTPAQRPACYRSASPRYAITAGMPPVLMLAAGRDHVVDLSFEYVLRDALRRRGVDVALIVLPWADHAFEDVAFGFHDRIALWFLRAFLRAHLAQPA